ncbi:pyridoxamine 5'-phosphate oxidase [Paenibacillus sp. J31TS4]|uniref:pyridoxine/pyridoxamine 5'-phosphate oxidase n=1 Tax=Paenibacillus sp. J31TS4 TaxID=2807195 RepID=UPI001B1AE994|nr:pyridoxal 5'-phosphate synthase [Paenibacillus sp. J31TS4]GIP40511.1 pyridoxamine 5'-phosphate oxidase [Paenibacillus sp. J31TS4]
MERTREAIRRSKTLAGPFPSFVPTHAKESPYALFLDWFQAALDHGVTEPHAMTLSTADRDGYPDARVLILKDVDEQGWYFASSSASRKGEQLQDNPYAALTFYWPPLGRQIRIRGTVGRMGKELSAQDFLNRGETARAIALLDRQSTILSEQGELDRALADQLAMVRQTPGLVAPTWTLYRLTAEEAEFWQGDEERRHIRLRYTRVGEGWTQTWLWP